MCLRLIPGFNLTTVDRYVATVSNVQADILLTTGSFFTDGTFGRKAINHPYVPRSLIHMDEEQHLLRSWLVRRLLMDVLTFEKAGPFLNLSRIPPPLLYGSRTSSSTSLSYNLCMKGVPNGVVNGIMFGTVCDSHINHPRIPKATATHSITIWPFQGEWLRALATMGMALDEDAFSYYVYENGVTFQGTWATPSKHDFIACDTLAVADP